MDDLPELVCNRRVDEENTYARQHRFASTEAKVRESKFLPQDHLVGQELKL